MRPSRLLSSLVFFLAAALPRVEAAPAKSARCVSSNLKNERRCAVANARIRAVSPDLADRYKALYSELMKLDPATAVTLDSLPELSPSDLAGYNRRRHELADAGVSIKGLGPFTADGRIPGATCLNPEGSPLYQQDFCVSAFIYVLASKNVPEHLEKIEADLNDLKNRTQQLEDDVNAAKAGPAAQDTRTLGIRLSELGVFGQKVWESLRLDNVNNEDSLYTLDPEDPKKQLNALQTDVADIAKRLKKIDGILHGNAAGRLLDDEAKRSAATRSRTNPVLQNTRPFGDAVASGGAPNGANPPVAGAENHMAGAAGVIAGANAMAAGAKTLLDMSTIPPLISDQANASGKPQAPVFAGAPGEDAAPEDTKRVDALRRAGKTATIGDVSRRAGYVFRQTGNTCGIGAQIQVLADLGEVPPDPVKLKAKEDELYDRAVSRGYFTGSAADPERRTHGGNDWNHFGDLLDRPINRLYERNGADLVKAISSGHMVLVTVDSGILWNATKAMGSDHFIAVTGVELDRETKQPIGYYINDTGTGEGGRFVGAKQFIDSWKERTMVVPQ
jgi:hypothetical protein